MTRSDLERGHYEQEKHPFEEKVGTGVGPDIVFEVAKNLYDGQNDRLASIQERTKNLVALCALLLPLFGGLLLPRLSKPWLAFFPLALVLWTILVLFLNMRLIQFGRPDLNEDFFSPEIGDKKAKGVLAQQYLQAAQFNYAVATLLAEIYTAACHVFAVALICFFLVASSSFVWQSAAAIPITNVQVNPATQPAPVVNFVPSPTSQPAPVVNLMLPATSQPAPVINITVVPSTQPSTLINIFPGTRPTTRDVP